MPKEKINSTTIIAAVIFFLLAGLAGWRWYAQKQASEQQQQTKDFITFDTAAVTDLSIVQGETTTTLQKQGDAWLVLNATTAPADDVAIESLLNTLNNAQIQATVSTNNTNVSDYGLTDAEKIRITVLANGATVADVEVGKAGAAARTWYGRKISDPTVYLLSGTRTTLVKTDWTKPPEPTTSDSTVGQPITEIPIAE